MMASPKEKPGSKAVMGTDLDKDADIRQPSVNGEPRTLDQMTMERAMVISCVALDALCFGFLDLFFSACWRSIVSEYCLVAWIQRIVG